MCADVYEGLSQCSNGVKQYCLAEDLDDQVKLTARSLDKVKKKSFYSSILLVVLGKDKQKHPKVGMKGNSTLGREAILRKGEVDLEFLSLGLAESS